MADRVRKMNYCHLKVTSRAGQGASVLAALREEGVNLLAFSGFPDKRGRSQLDLIPEDMVELRRVARKNGWRLSKAKKGFLVTGSDTVGAVHRQLDKLASRKINVTSAQAAMAGKGRYGMMLWVRPKDYARAARVLRAK